ncbi:MAG: D-xylose transport system permease protein [Pseudonocardiales bacterium]|nr:D-xylose transport system permease protein [Pseudonocardiales bacterium]
MTAQISAAAAPAETVTADQHVRTTFREYAADQARRIRRGDSGTLPVLVGFVVIIVIFQTQNSNFLSSGNIVNLIQQASLFVVFGLAEIFILLLGEIDLSIGFNAGVGAAVTAELAAPPHNQSWLIAVLAGVAVCSLFGAMQGLIVTRLGVPAFIVTLAGYLGLQGVSLWLFDQDTHAVGGTISVTNKTLSGIVYSSLSPLAGWIVMIALVASYAALSLAAHVRRARAHLAAAPLALVLAKIVTLAVAGVLLVIICNRNRSLSLFTSLRGVPYVVLVVLALVIIYSFVLDRTRFGRYVYAIGGNAEAARRAGINVRSIRLACFVLAGFTAGIAGVVADSFLGSAQSNFNGGIYVLYAVAAAVIGGTSLFGGRGRMVHALIGGFVIAAIANGMFLLGLSSAAQEMVNAVVLVAAVTVDAVARRRTT